MQPLGFDQLQLSAPIMRALTQAGYSKPTDIQRAAIPELLEGRDLCATAQTGTGKTAAFSLPMIQRLSDDQDWKPVYIRGLVLAPTRELALQVGESLRTYGRFTQIRSTVILGGVSAVPQIKALRRIPDILVATPGRLLDLMNQGHVQLDGIEFLVLDEADRMLDMGFIHDVRKIVSHTPSTRQTMLFSATMPREIVELSADLLVEPSRVEVAPPATIADNVTQQVYFVDKSNKRDLLKAILKDGDIGRALVFTRTKYRADRIKKQLTKAGIRAEAIHSKKSQGARQRALREFDRGRTTVLVATDIVARGIDVSGITHVINFEMPGDPESYVHRIGRTARAGAMGVAVSFCDIEEVPLLHDIEKLTQIPLTPFEDHDFHAEGIAEAHRNGPLGRRGAKHQQKSDPKTGPGKGGRPHRSRQGGRAGEQRRPQRRPRR